MDPSHLQFLYYLDKGTESSIIMALYKDQHLIGKLYHKA